MTATLGLRTQEGTPLASDFADWLKRTREEVEVGLSVHLKEIETTIGAHSRLAAAVQYSLQVGGKRIRPILVLETCRVCGGQATTAFPAAIAIECIHTFSLIHDDLPAMDNDDTRRGQPTNHKVFGDGLAVLAGDWLATHALYVLATMFRHEPRRLPALVEALSGATLRMIEGQAADLAGEQQPPDRRLVQIVHERKTAALLEACCRLGALCAGAPSEAVTALANYGRHLGLAFQIVDDLLDATGSAEQLGKAAGKDAAHHKQTYPAAFGLEESQRRARQEEEAALQRLECFGGRADRLRDLVRYVTRRDR